MFIFIFWECGTVFKHSCQLIEINIICQTADQQYQDAFNDELESFKERVRGRAKIRIEKAMKEYEEEERQKRLGPGGLDPVEVYESLPEVTGLSVSVWKHDSC